MPQRTAAAIYQTMGISQVLSALDLERPLPRPSATPSNTSTSQALSNKQSELTDTEHEEVREAPEWSANAFAIGQDFEMTEEEAAATLVDMKEAASCSSSADSQLSRYSHPSSKNAGMSVEQAAITLLSMKKNTSSSSSSSVDSRVLSSSYNTSARSPRESSSRISKPSSNPKNRTRAPGGRELNGLKDFLPLPRNAGLESKQARRERKTWNSRSTFGT